MDKTLAKNIAILEGNIGTNKKMKMYKVMAAPTLLFGSETWYQHKKKKTNGSTNMIKVIMK